MKQRPVAAVEAELAALEARLAACRMELFAARVVEAVKARPGATSNQITYAVKGGDRHRTFQVLRQLEAAGVLAWDLAPRGGRQWRLVSKDNTSPATGLFRVNPRGRQGRVCP